MSDIILWIVVGMVLGVWLFYLGLKIAISRLVRQIENDLEQALDKVQEESSIPCRVELYNDTFFVYNNDTNEFMVQGKDLKELRQRLKDRWADKKVSLVAGEESVLETLRTQLNESSTSK